MVRIGVVLALLGAAVAPASVSDKTLVVGEGIGGIKMGMTQAEVKAAAGKPLSQNRNGVLSYEEDTSARIFDVYLDQGKKTPTVDLIIQAGKGIKTAEGISVYAKGGLKELQKAYPRMRYVRQDTDTDQNVWRIKTRKGGHPVWTDFTPGVSRKTLDARVIQVMVVVPR